MLSIMTSLAVTVANVWKHDEVRDSRNDFPPFFFFYSPTRCLPAYRIDRGGEIILQPGNECFCQTLYTDFTASLKSVHKYMKLAGRTNYRSATQIWFNFF